MAENHEAYQQYMDTGHNAAWDQNWQEAVKAYSQAIKEVPNDPDAHVHLGLSLLRAGRLDDSLKVYMKAHELSPEDPVPLEKSADVLENMGRMKEAAQQYVQVADTYLSVMKDLEKAIDNWERATHLTPGLTSVHAKLGQAYERVGDKKKAVREYLILAYDFYRTDETERAIKAVERALRLDKRDPHALNTLRALRSGGEVTMPDFEDEYKTQQTKPSEPDLFSSMEADRANIGEADPLGPLGEAMSTALVTLAAYVVESGALDASGADALQAMEFQRQGVDEQAIEAYKRAALTLRHPALKMSLGTLLMMNDQPAEAVEHLGEAIMDPQLSAGALHALGKSYYAVDKQKQASRYLIQSLQAVDTSLAANDAEASELSEIYTRLLGALDGRTDEALEAINSRFVDLLSGRDWKQRISETRRHLEEVMRDQGDQGVVDFLGTGGSDRLAATVSRIDSYIRQGFLTLAMDEAHTAVESSPYYLPVHVRMAEIMMREGRLRQAINKYNTVARSYMSREENDRAASILVEVLEMAPLDVSVRVNLIELLEHDGRGDEVLDQYIELAKTYNQLGSFDKARETYTHAERMIQSNGASTEKLITIKRSIADMEQMRLDTRRAIKVYEEIIELAPEDTHALRNLVDLSYGYGNTVDGLKYVDKLLSIYAQRKQISSIVQILEELVRIYTADTGLRSRLAMILKQLNRKAEAIEQLDVLGELQLEAGLHEDARGTIKQIIDLEPENIEDYRRLLSQLGG